MSFTYGVSPPLELVRLARPRTRTSTRELKQRLCELRVLDVRANIDEILFGLHIRKTKYNNIEKNTDFSIISQIIATFVPDFS